jgi:integrase/recombinase XerD
MRLTSCIYQFFDQYLPHIKGCSPNTVKSYRDMLTLFLPFVAGFHAVKIDSLKPEHLSSEAILAFLNWLESERHNTSRTRNQRLAVLKSLAKMIRFMYPEKRKLAESIIAIPQKRSQRKLIGFLYPQEIFNVFQSVNIIKKDGFRDYTILHLLYDSGARAAEIAELRLNYFDCENRTLAILGKANRYRQIELLPKTTALIDQYITKYRRTPNAFCKAHLFINQRGAAFTRHGINRLCKKYLTRTLSAKRLNLINPAHSFRHYAEFRIMPSSRYVTVLKPCQSNKLMKT